ncbi:transcription repressor NadR [Priestia koreensis]|uniref:transcription repressor NadR n=1 Tax=Priestia koreensis TaxID=284581 RepID=UPI001F573D5F|nr:transcription repressor NadR [Priestia koreensis]MCM3002631.1 transcription repressor NadR [Priestia koreensis]UNL84336.1 transcription repressor NadR [Priestia koreensis]
MTEANKKILGEQRRTLILEWLQTEGVPLTGSELSKRTNVSRQVIVQDISLLKAKNEPIIATSQGYLYMQTPDQKGRYEQIIACQHGPETADRELFLLVDHGVRVRDVIVEHPIYGELTASIMVSTRKEVEAFLEHVKNTNASYLSQLTDGTHLHTIEADTPKKLQEACAALRKEGFLIES